MNGWTHCVEARDEEMLPLRWADWCSQCREAFLTIPVKPNGSKGKGALFDPNRDPESWPTPRL